MGEKEGEEEEMVHSGTPLTDSTNLPPPTTQPSQAKKSGATMSFDEYKRMSNMIVFYIRRREEDEELQQASELNEHVEWMFQGRFIKANYLLLLLQWPRVILGRCLKV